MEWYLSDYDWAYAWDGKQLYLLGKNGLSKVSGEPDPMWSGITEEDAKKYYVAPINNK